MSTQLERVDLGVYLSLVREEMRRVLATRNDGPEEFRAAMLYAVGGADEHLHPGDTGGGKLLRPRLCLLACGAAGGDAGRAVPAAAAVELLHNFTLVHDDIQDNSPTRRHLPTLWSLIGVPLAINAGDAMFATSHLVLASLLEQGVPPSTVLRALEQFDITARRLCEGQHLDISFEQRSTVSSDEYLAMIERKTGALMGLSCYLGALVAGKPEETLRLYEQFGEVLGAGYQIRDDLAGVWHEEASTGKRLMEDIYRRKKSYPAVRAFETATGAEVARLREIYAAPAVEDSDAHWARDLMSRLGLYEEGRARIQGCVQSGLRALKASNARGPAAEQLREFANGLLS